MGAYFEGIGTYVTMRKNTVAHYISTQPIMDLCERSAQRPEARVSWWWWENSGLDLEGAKKRESAAVAGSDGE